MQLTWRITASIIDSKDRLPSIIYLPVIRGSLSVQGYSLIPSGQAAEYYYLPVIRGSLSVQGYSLIPSGQAAEYY